jgi:hypothetical protein
MTRRNEPARFGSIIRFFAFALDGRYHYGRHAFEVEPGSVQRLGQD